MFKIAIYSVLEYLFRLWWFIVNEVRSAAITSSIEVCTVQPTIHGSSFIKIRFHLTGINYPCFGSWFDRNSKGGLTSLGSQTLSCILTSWFSSSQTTWIKTFLLSHFRLLDRLQKKEGLGQAKLRCMPKNTATCETFSQIHYNHFLS